MFCKWPSKQLGTVLGHGYKVETLYPGTESGTGTSLHTILASAQEHYPQTTGTGHRMWTRIQNSFAPVPGHQVWTTPKRLCNPLLHTGENLVSFEQGKTSVTLDRLPAALVDRDTGCEAVLHF